MIAAASIQQVRDIPIIDIISKYEILKIRGNQATCCCPFHSEKTPSFSISNTKSIYKCFGCGESGDGIRFVMQRQKLEFYPAIEEIAKDHNILLEYIQNDSEEYKRIQTLTEQQNEAIAIAVDFYHEQLIKLPDDHIVKEYLKKRGFGNYIVGKWQIGWCSQEWRQLTEKLINKGLYEAAHTLGIIATGKDNSHYDAFRSRIIFPIQNQSGKYVGLGGRWMPVLEKDKSINAAKYRNTSSDENSIYQKSNILYGLSQASFYIKKQQFLYLSEGYADVISMHSYGDKNTIATCGTALTKEQAKIIKKYTDHVVILRDGDNAGLSAAVKDLSVLIQEGIHVDIITIPDKMDPDEYINSVKNAAA